MSLLRFMRAWLAYGVSFTIRFKSTGWRKL
jgi:hypothetical protein